MLLHYVNSDIKVMSGPVNSIKVLEKHLAQLHNERSSVQDMVKLVRVGRVKINHEMAPIMYMINELKSKMDTEQYESVLERCDVS
jgi:hypothetical protein